MAADDAIARLRTMRTPTLFRLSVGAWRCPAPMRISQWIA
jgi:hypothetical protein